MVFSQSFEINNNVYLMYQLHYFHRDLMDNKVFFQHPDLMRALCLHETVMQLMVNTLNKAQQQQMAAGGDLNTTNQRRHSTVHAGAMDNSIAESSKVKLNL